MSLKQWEANGWLQPHQAEKKEVVNLLHVVGRDLKDAKEHNISYDWRFGIAYNAALKLCTILLVAEGYRAQRTLQHYRTVQAMPEIFTDSQKVSQASTAPNKFK